MSDASTPPPTRLGKWIGPWYGARPSERIAWAVVAAACTAVIGTAIGLTPSPAGMGTHEALGLPPCGFVYTSGLPCPTCGMTTSYSLAVRGRIFASIVAQPAGFVLFLLTGVVAIYGWLLAIRGRAIWINWDRISARLMLTLAFLILGGWGFKIAHGLTIGTLPSH